MASRFHAAIVANLAEHFARRVANLRDRCYEISSRQLAEAADNTIADIRCSATVLEHKAESYRRGR